MRNPGDDQECWLELCTTQWISRLSRRGNLQKMFIGVPCQRFPDASMSQLVRVIGISIRTAISHGIEQVKEVNLLSGCNLTNPLMLSAAHLDKWVSRLPV